MTVTLFDSEVQEICDATNAYLEGKSIGKGWLCALFLKHSSEWIDKKILEYLPNLEDSESKEEAIVVLESLVLCRHSCFLIPASGVQRIELLRKKYRGSFTVA